MERLNKNDAVNVCGSTYTVLKLLGHGKGGYSYLAESEGKRVTLKAIHHEPCEYYTFGDKIAAEMSDYGTLCDTGIRLPKLIACDREQEIIIKEYIDGPTVEELVAQNRMTPDCYAQIREMCRLVYAKGLNIDYYPTNFILQDGELYYIDYECNRYSDEWNFENWGCKYWHMSGTLPTIPLDYPDPDVIRVGDTYYLVSTTMHFMPGCEILRSKDLVSWEHASYVYDMLDSTPGQKLENGGVYGRGMWAATLRYHKGTFYILFVANDTHKTYLYRSRSIEGPWEKSVVDGFFHDASLLFDDDRVFIVYGNRHIFLTELDSELKGPLKGGVSLEIVTDNDRTGLGYEGSHFYKINGRYYVFFIHSLPDVWKRVESCYVADRVDGPYRGCDIFNEDLGYFNSGIAQGGIVDTPDGRFFAILFQDRGASGRMPFLLPVDMSGDMPVIEARKVTDPSETAGAADAAAAHGGCAEGLMNAGLYGSDSFEDAVIAGGRASGRVTRDASRDCFGLKSFWQFNHEPELKLVSAGDGRLRITTDRVLPMPADSEDELLCKAPAVNAVNMLTQRLKAPGCSVSVDVDASELGDGDCMGICALQYCFIFAGIRRNGDAFEFFGCEGKNDGGRESICFTEPVKAAGPKARIRMTADFDGMKDEISFFYDEGEGFRPLAGPKKMVFSLKHFTGVRAGLTVYSTLRAGGTGTFSSFVYE